MTDVLLLHGWSAEQDSLYELQEFLQANGYRTHDLFFGDYPSMTDHVRLEDSAVEMGQKIGQLQGAGTLADRFHLVCHSTGALVTRHYLSLLEDPADSPIENLLMLAPANFGSPLAHQGRSLLGRLTKGLFNGLETGTEFLHALELASSFQEQLALTDRLSLDGTTDSPFGADRTRAFTIVGCQVVPGADLITSESGWDGTVRIASANIDPEGMTVDFAAPGATALEPKLTRWTRRGPERTPFAVLPDRDHRTVLRPAPDESSSRDRATAMRLGQLILRALRSTPEDYDDIRAEWDRIRHETRKLCQRNEPARRLKRRILGRRHPRRQERFREHYQVIVDVVDSGGHPVTDYEVWLTAVERAVLGTRRVASRTRVTEIEVDARRNLLKDQHRNRRNPERLSLHIDRRHLLTEFLPDRFRKDAADGGTLAAGITAIAPGQLVGYFTTRSDEGSGLIQLRAHVPDGPDTPDRFLKRYATHFLRVVIPRVRDSRVFELETRSSD